MSADYKSNIRPEKGAEHLSEGLLERAHSRGGEPVREIPRGIEDDLVHEEVEGQGKLFGPDAYDWDDERLDPQARLVTADSATERDEAARSGEDRQGQRSGEDREGKPSGQDRKDQQFRERPAGQHSKENQEDQLPAQRNGEAPSLESVRSELPLQNQPIEAAPSGAGPFDQSQDNDEAESDSAGQDQQDAGKKGKRVRRRVRVAREDSSDESNRRWKSHAKKRKDKLPGYAYVIFAVIFFGFAYLVHVAWQGDGSLFEPSFTASQSAGTADSAGQNAQNIPMPTGANVIPWERDALDALNAGEKHAAAGSMSGAEADVDRAKSTFTAARIQSQPVDPGFFGAAISALDRVLQKLPQDTKLAGLVTSARVELATLRSAQQIPSGALGTRAVSLAGTRHLAPGDALKPQDIGGQYIDATVMAELVEVLAPPPTRSLADNVNVDGITIAGATQTLDGIHWHNVEFVDTRVRYGDGDLDLQDVHFIRCTFTLPNDERGAELADAIAMGKASITIGVPAK